MAGFCKEHQNMYAGGYCIMCANQKAAGTLSQPTGDLTELLCGCEKIFAGKRGAKDQIQDINEAITSLERLKEIIKKRELKAKGRTDSR